MAVKRARSEAGGEGSKGARQGANEPPGETFITWFLSICGDNTIAGFRKLNDNIYWYRESFSQNEDFQ